MFIPIPTDAPAINSRAGITAVVLSGDMGFNAGMAGSTASRLTADGIPVLGVNSLVYFRTQRTPAEVEGLLAKAIRKALALGHTDKVVLIGQSFGADMIPVGLAGLPDELRSKVRMVVMVVPTDTLYFRASPSELFNWSKPDADALPTAHLLDWLPVVCISGLEETESLCPHMTTANVRHVQLPGGHALHWDADSVHRTIVDAIDKSAAAEAQIKQISET